MSFLCCLVCCLNVSFSRLITSVEARELFFCYRLYIFLLFLFEGVPLPLGA